MASNLLPALTYPMSTVSAYTSDGGSEETQVAEPVMPLGLLTKSSSDWHQSSSIEQAMISGHESHVSSLDLWVLNDAGHALQFLHWLQLLCFKLALPLAGNE